MTLAVGDQGWPPAVWPPSSTLVSHRNLPGRRIKREQENSVGGRKNRSCPRRLCRDSCCAPGAWIDGLRIVARIFPQIRVAGWVASTAWIEAPGAKQVHNAANNTIGNRFPCVAGRPTPGDPCHGASWPTLLLLT